MNACQQTDIQSAGVCQLPAATTETSRYSTASLKPHHHCPRATEVKYVDCVLTCPSVPPKRAPFLWAGFWPSFNTGFLGPS